MRNALLANPEQVEMGALLKDGRVGLYVVAVLARQHQIRVELRRNLFGGVAGLVLLPNPLLSEGGEDGEGEDSRSRAAERPPRRRAARLPRSPPPRPPRVTSSPTPQYGARPAAATGYRAPSAPEYARGHERRRVDEQRHIVERRRGVRLRGHDVGPGPVRTVPSAGVPYCRSPVSRRSVRPTAACRSPACPSPPAPRTRAWTGVSPPARTPSAAPPRRRPGASRRVPGRTSPRRPRVTSPRRPPPESYSPLPPPGGMAVRGAGPDERPPLPQRTQQTHMAPQFQRPQSRGASAAPRRTRRTSLPPTRASWRPTAGVSGPRKSRPDRPTSDPHICLRSPDLALCP